MEISSKIAWKIVPLIQFFPLKVFPLIEVLLYLFLYKKIKSKKELETKSGKELKKSWGIMGGKC
jgi:hypothetical protein